MSYIVMICNEGESEEYVGEASTLKEARSLCHQHARGKRTATSRSLWDTARASGNPVEGCDYPGAHEDEPVEWVQSRFAPRNAYAICRAVDQES